MKIIINNDVYVQIKDLKHLSYFYKNRKYIEEYIHYINNQKTENEFIKINDDKKKREIIECEDILNIMEYKNYHFLTLQKLLSSQSISNIYFENKSSNKKIEELKEIIRLKQGNLDYTIPLIPDYRIEEENQILNLKLYSTIYDLHFIIKPIQGQINTNNIDTFIRYVFTKHNISKDYKYIIKDNEIIVTITKQKSKRLTKKR